MLGRGIVRQVGDGAETRIGIDLLLGGKDFSRLSEALIDTLNGRGYMTLDHLRAGSSGEEHYWLVLDGSGR